LLVGKNVSKRYGKVKALSSVSFDVGEGEILGILGPNGAGKTTLIKCILGLLNFDGEILVDGIDVRRYGAIARRKIGYVPQKLALHDKLSILDETRLFAGLKRVYDERMVRELLEKLGLWERRKNSVGSLSQGMKQKLILGLTLLADPEVLLLDEPLSNVDIEGQVEILKQLEERKKERRTVVITSHTVGMGKVIDKALVINAGRVVVFGRTEDVLSMIRLRSKIYLKINTVGEAKPIINELRSLSYVYEVSNTGEWTIVECDTGYKPVIISQLMSSGLRVEDIFTEEVSLDKYYYKLIEERKS